MQELVVRGVERLAAAVAPEVAEVVDQCRRLKDEESPRHELTRRTARPFRADAVVFAAERGVVEALDELDAVESIQHRRFQQLVYFLFVTHVFQLFNSSTFQPPFGHPPKGSPVSPGPRGGSRSEPITVTTPHIIAYADSESKRCTGVQGGGSAKAQNQSN